MQITTPAIVAFAIVALGFVAIAFAEVRQGRAEPAEHEHGRIATNFTLGILNALVALALPFSTATAAIVAAQRGWGVLHHIEAPFAAGLLGLLLARSLGMYVFHRASHAVPWMWRFHRVHHADRAFDLSTAFRSHPFEVVLATPIAAGVVIGVGATLQTVIAVDAALLLIAMWEHGDFRVPASVERMVGLAIATPAQHRLHHSPQRARHDRNFGDTLILWDRLFGTFLPPDETRSPVGLANPKSAGGLFHQLKAPFAPL